MPMLLIQLPETVDPHMVDQLGAAVQRMGGQIQPMPDEEGPADMAAEPGGEPPMEMAMGEQGPAPVPPGMMQAPPMEMGSSAIKRPSQLRAPVPKR